MYSKLLFELNSTLLHQRFLSTDVGQLYLAIPWQHLAALVPPPPHQMSGKGCQPWFTVEGGIALLFLKHYLQLSDAKLIERINCDWSLQYFCGIQLKAGEIIRDKDLPSAWRCYIGQHLDITKWQKALATKWKKYMQQTQTCYLL
jgi:hypothetical protein